MGEGRVKPPLIDLPPDLLCHTIHASLARCGGDVTAAARELQISAERLAELLAILPMPTPRPDSLH